MFPNGYGNGYPPAGPTMPNGGGGAYYVQVSPRNATHVDAISHR